MRPFSASAIVAATLLGSILTAPASAAVDSAKLEELTRAVDPQVIAWRRDIHEHPELSNREVRTAKVVADHLKKLGLEVQTGIAHNGVVGLLKGGSPGRTVALRADMDALPIIEKTDVPFKSKATSTFRGETVGVMHACGHDSHTAMLLGAATALSKIKSSLAGNVVFIFQPAEEGAPEGEEGGAQLMLKQGMFDKYKPDAVFGLHVMSMLHTGEIGYRSGPFMAATDSFSIQIKGRQAHGSRPWQSIDPIVTAAQMVNNLQTVVSRYTDITLNPAVVTIGAIRGGVRHNIIPDSLEMLGTIRTFDPDQRDQVIANVKRIVEHTAASNGATATLNMAGTRYPVTFNNPELTEKMLPTLKRVAGEDKVKIIPLNPGAEDFSFYAQKAPSVFVFLGVTPPDRDVLSTPSNHSDLFYIDEKALPVGTRVLTHLVTDYLKTG